MPTQFARALDDKLQAAWHHGILERVFTELATVTRVVAKYPRLRKVLADGGIRRDERARVLSEAAAGVLSSETIDIVCTTAEMQHVDTDSFDNKLAEVTATAAFVLGDKDRSIRDIENTLYTTYKTLVSSPELHGALTNPTVRTTVKENLMADLFAGRAHARSIELIKMLVALDGGRDVAHRAKVLAEQAAERRDRLIADIRTAVELDDEHKSALLDALQKKLGRRVEARYSVDKSIIGSVLIRVGDEIIDGSVRHRIAEARQLVAGTRGDQ